VTNVRGMLARLALDFDETQLDLLVSCCQRGLGGSPKDTAQLLAFVGSLAEGAMAHKVSLASLSLSLPHPSASRLTQEGHGQVLDLVWGLAHDDAAPPETVAAALETHHAILDKGFFPDKRLHRQVPLPVSRGPLLTRPRPSLWVPRV
jgi:hypothetical protein